MSLRLKLVSLSIFHELMMCESVFGLKTNKKEKPSMFSKDHNEYFGLIAWTRIKVTSHKTRAVVAAH